MRVTVSESMIEAAINSGARRGVLAPAPDRDGIRAMLQSAVQLIGRSDSANAYPLDVVGPTRARLRAKFVRMGQQRGYMVVETQDGQLLNIHANEVFNASTR